MLLSATATVQPTASLVIVPEVKAAARIDSGHEDDLIVGYIAAAELTVENICRRSFRPQTWRAFYKDVIVGTPEPLPRSPVASVVVSYRDSATTWVDATPTTILDAAPALWYPPADVTPYAMSDGSPNWKATAVCGADALPPPVKNAIILLAAHLFEQRSPIVIGATVTDVPMTIEFLLAPYVVQWT